MFTKYSGIVVPQNYNGNRFKKQPLETEMKTHKATEVQSVSSAKTSVSPSFQSLLDKAVGEGDAFTVPVQEEISSVEVEDSAVEEETEKEFSQEEAPAELSISPFMRMLEGLKSDDLLLLALILLFADCKSEMGNEAIILLSLLLLC